MLSLAVVWGSALLFLYSVLGIEFYALPSKLKTNELYLYIESKHLFKSHSW